MQLQIKPDSRPYSFGLWGGSLLRSPHSAASLTLLLAVLQTYHVCLCFRAIALPVPLSGTYLPPSIHRWFSDFHRALYCWSFLTKRRFTPLSTVAGRSFPPCQPSWAPGLLFPYCSTCPLVTYCRSAGSQTLAKTPEPRVAVLPSPQSACWSPAPVLTALPLPETGPSHW